MKEITITFSPDELVELAKQLYLGGFFSLCAGDHGNTEMVNEIMNRVCATGMAQAPETNAFRMGGPGEPAFFISQDVDEECDPLVELYNDSVIAEYLPFALADRDFAEQYGVLEAEEVFESPELFTSLKALQKKYLDEFERYGVTHLRLEEK